MDMEKLLDRYTAASQKILGANLKGLYLHGSAAMGCFNPLVSDIDIIAVVHDPLSEAAKRDYMEMVTVLDREVSGKGIEMSVVLESVCSPFVYPTPYELHFSRMHLKRWQEDPDGYLRQMQGVDPDLAAHFTVIRQRGRCLCGRPIPETFDEVDRKYYLDSIMGDVSSAETEILANPVYYILNLCRVLAFVTEGSVLSKEEGGIWQLNRATDDEKPIIERALAEYRTQITQAWPETDLSEFASEMLKRISQKTYEEDHI